MSFRVAYFAKSFLDVLISSSHSKKQDKTVSYIKTDLLFMAQTSNVYEHINTLKPLNEMLMFFSDIIHGLPLQIRMSLVIM